MSARPTRRTVTGAALVLCVPAAVAAIVLGVTTPGPATAGALQSGSARNATAAARTAVRDILSYDYRHLPADIARARADATGVFAHEYAGTATRLLHEATQLKAIVRANVTAAGVVSASPHDVVVLMFVDQDSVRQTPGQRTPTTRIDQSRVRATMTLVGRRWKVSDLAAL